MQQGGETRDESKGGKRGFLTRLAKDARGNTLALVGAALLPLAAMIGSGVDMSRAYMAKTRLQSACDSAALAGRRVLSEDTLTDSTTDPVRVEAEKFFSFNFPDGIYETTPVTPVVTKPEQGTIAISASTEIPTGIMFLFGFESLDIDVSCQASQNFVNTDIVLVLDVTGSMLCDADGTDCDGDSNSKIAGLRSAVKSLFDELEPIQEQLEDAGLRLRYGFVPYSSNVNVGTLIRAEEVDDGAQYLVNTGTYQSRQRGDWNWSGLTVSRCASRYNGTHNATTNMCQNIWIYKPITIDVSLYKTGSAITNPSGASATTTWNGCIEERPTDSGIDASSGYTIPDAATDLDINLVPSSDADRWKPAVRRAIYSRPGVANAIIREDNDDDDAYYQGTAACPVLAAKLQAWSETDFDAYADGLGASGGTYHDIGMIWGARFISDEGIFGEENPTTFGDMPVNKHIIFMTDGLLQPNDSYTAYSLEAVDQRVTGTTYTSSVNRLAAQTPRHRQRFKMICNAAKQLNISIWAIGFGAEVTSSTDDMAALRDCASSDNQVSSSANNAALIAKFVEIGKNIGTLRLTQ